MPYEMNPVPPADGPGTPPPPPPAPPAGDLRSGAPVIPAFPPVLLLPSTSGLVWVIGNDYSRGWDGTMWVSLS